MCADVVRDFNVFERLEGPRKDIPKTSLTEIRWHGRGGQGAVTAAKILAKASRWSTSRSWPWIPAWPLFEIEGGTLRLTHRPKEKRPIIEYLKTQGRYRHLLDPVHASVIEEIQKEVDVSWERLQAGRLL